MMRLILTATAIITGSSVVYFYVFHQRLASTIQHKAHRGTLTASTNPTGIESIPDAVFTDQYFTIADSSSKSVLRACLPENESTEQLFKRLVRRNMTAFSRFPQALMLKMALRTPEEKHSFKRSHISCLDFKEGDLACGIYRVKLRKENRVEFEMQMKTMDFVNGRLAISCQEKEDSIVFRSETVMWRKADESRIMPLERPAIRWMHETAMMWLIDSGARYLMDLET
ncbi:hypothetical protein PENANT_c007G00150 [Penicillium antarcticum]|uniref:Uncharacterized protein n=1 Tax=Penicillium antarcticum TaxID=416450 RepID=A0A1V6QCK4_9EURO|nr:uncharacterized protein N7508_003637 [Penicillium antarcticum]KAJ5312807.1 hypothetical protein N7508_003637 [Penicillium antarcticum]OQD86762.1 hypothetical protein PENANT_c007G00150 [Penicillium antarcticum]